MKRKIIRIDQEKCNGCGLCAGACHEGAIGIQDGKAVLLREDYCDGLGNCLPACPTGAITFEEREAMAYDESAVKAHLGNNVPFTCPGTQMHSLKHDVPVRKETVAQEEAVSQLNQWPVQIQLVPPNAPYFRGANLLIAADCTAYACAGFHNRFMCGKVTLIGCPKLDDADYAEKLKDIFEMNDIRSITVVRMEVPCCGGIVSAVTDAMIRSGKMIPWSVVTVSIEGEILA